MTNLPPVPPMEKPPPFSDWWRALGIQAVGLALLIWSWIGGSWLIGLGSIVLCSIAIALYVVYLRRLNEARQVNDLRFNQWLDHVRELKRRESQ
jgi:hypothetical protein